MRIDIRCVNLIVNYPVAVMNFQERFREGARGVQNQWRSQSPPCSHHSLRLSFGLSLQG